MGIAEPVGEIFPVDETNLAAAAAVHAESWRASHAAICDPAFVAAHSAARQKLYLQEKQCTGSSIFLLTADRPAGVVSVCGNLIEDLPDREIISLPPGHASAGGVKKHPRR